jgi:hypothetical protein
MSDNAPPLTLAERMAEALKGVGDVNDAIDRVLAYHVAGLSFTPVGVSRDEYAKADGEARSTELLRRLGGANDHA